MTRASARQQGFTVIEVVAASMLMALTVVSGTRAFLTLLEATHRSGKATTAGALAVAVLERVRSAPESQADLLVRRERFTGIADDGPNPFAAPFAGYTYRVQVNDVLLSPASAYPCWLTAAPPATCISEPDHADTMKWVTVEIASQGRKMSRITSAVIRDMNGAR